MRPYSPVPHPGQTLLINPSTFSHWAQIFFTMVQHEGSHYLAV